MRAFAAVLMVLCACESSVTALRDASVAPLPDASAGFADASAASPDASLPSGACAGRACLDRIRVAAEFDQLSRPSPAGACQFDREIMFVLPRDGTSPLQDTYYVDANAHRHVLDFVRADLGGTYATIDVEAFFRTFEREDMRQYYVGRIRRLIGDPVRYAFDLQESGYFGVGGGDRAVELAAVTTALRRTFALPLGYAPSLYSRIREAESLQVSFDVHLPAACPGETCAAGAGPCVVVPQGAELCTRFQDNRSIQAEHLRQTRLTFAPGNHRLANGATIPLISGGVHGPGRVAVTPDGDARVMTMDVGGTTYWSLEQTVHAGNLLIAMTMSISDPSRPLILREPFMSDVQIYGLIDGGMTNDDVVHLESCDPRGLPLYFAEADLGNGDRLRMEYRHQVPFAGSGPLMPVGADVTLGGVTRRLDGHPSIIYAGVHHNWNNQFWLLLSPPMQAFGHDVHGLWIDEPGTTCCPVDAVHTLDANYQRLDTFRVMSYLRAPTPF